MMGHKQEVVMPNTDKICIWQLGCYVNANEEQRCHRLVNPDREFDLNKLPEGIRSEMRDFIVYRGNDLSLLSMRTELGQFNLFAKFISAEFPELQHFIDIPQEQMERAAKKWLIKTGRVVVRKRTRTETGKKVNSDSELLKYIRGLYKYFQAEEKTFNYDADRWYLDEMPLEIQQNPTKIVRSISFAKIVQGRMKEEVKQIIFLHLSQVTIGTVLAEMTAINRFFRYLYEAHPELESVKAIDRELIEEYLVYLHTEAVGRKSYTTELSLICTLFTGLTSKEGYFYAIFT